MRFERRLAAERALGALGSALKRSRQGALAAPDVARLSAYLHRQGQEGVTAANVEADAEREEPIFILATGWRTGSTLVQRLLSTDTRLWLWGEPYGGAALLRGLLEPLAAVSQGIVGGEAFGRAERGDAARAWIANMSPLLADYRASLQAMLLRLFRDPARSLGYERWGLKEVRFGYAEARLLAWLFPAARFLVVVRDPRDAYRSAISMGTLWEKRPDEPVSDAWRYGLLWNRLAAGWPTTDASLSFMVLRYEDLLADRDRASILADYLRLTLSPDAALDTRVGGSKRRHRLTVVDRWALARTCRDGMLRHGYAP